VTFELIREWIGGGLVVVGGFFMVIGAVGIFRMPDVFTRMHAASVADTLGGGFTLVGLMLIAGFSLVAVKLGFLILFFGVISPVSTHAIARAALYGGTKGGTADDETAAMIAEEVPPSKR
jgi:multicomponent Na+:H+ antiporter subunit G